VATTKSQGCGNSNQQQMADANSLAFWRQLADLFKGDGHVLFELYNEPHDISSDVWLHGGLAGNTSYVGMQQLYDAVRGEGADNVVVVGGLQWAYNLGFVGPAQHVQGYNVMYATHPYLTSGNVPASWESSFGHLETTDFAPVIATEFGDSSASCTGSWDQELIAFCDAHQASWTAWAWYPSDCHFPALIRDWAGTPTLQGAVVKQSLGNYPMSPGGTAAIDAGSEAAPGAAVEGGSQADDAADESDPGQGADAGGEDAVPAGDAGDAPDDGLHD
ncbi:MAG: cellulase family glycosylhydrolase, partial [Myxococcales bacterium]|nr:cellulase family glycosylhydrolase [Myxococcales bacterium]